MTANSFFLVSVSPLQTLHGFPNDLCSKIHRQTVLPGRVDGRKGDLRRVSRVSPGSNDVSSEDEDVVWNTPDLEPD